MRSRGVGSGAAFALALVVALGAERAAAQGGAAGALALDATQSMRDNLVRVQSAKRSVELVLKNGKSYRGLVGGVGDHAILLTQIEGREFFDALIALDEIAALEMRVRGTP